MSTVGTMSLAEPLVFTVPYYMGTQHIRTLKIYVLSNTRLCYFYS